MSELRKKQEYKELRPVGTYDVAALESWLEERAREGSIGREQPPAAIGSSLCCGRRDGQRGR